MLAEFEGRIVANVSLHRQTFGWGRHVGEIRIAVADDFRGRGLSSVLLDEVSHVAARQGLEEDCRSGDHVTAGHDEGLSTMSASRMSRS
ncbi:MAG: GNAT family N-acetyltransferase [Desulfobacterales bacterium]|nr:GNAT family N-acetyltransferase [Desulfobacterales bacterium]